MIEESIKLWNIATGEVWSVSFYREGLLASGSDGRTIRI